MTSFTSLGLLIALFLMLASLFLYFQKRQKNPSEQIKNKQRLLVWWLIFGVCLVVFKIGDIAVHIFVIALLYWVFREIRVLFEQPLSSYLLVFLCSMIFVLSLLLSQYTQFSLLIFSLAIVFAGLVYLTPIICSFYIPAICLYVLCSLLSILMMLALAEKASLDYSYLLLMLFFVTSLNDIAQYVSGKVFGGKLFGKTPIAPKLSPNKTIEGLWGGIIVSSLVCTVLLTTYLSISILGAFAFGSLLALAGFLGDLVISKLKRGLGIKDSGNSITGHGGILDRVDSLLLSAPVFGLLLQLVLHQKGYL